MSDEYSNEELSKKLDTILHILEGEESDHKDSGLIGAVNKNSELRCQIKEDSMLQKIRKNSTFRKFGYWAIGVMTGAVITRAVYLFMENIKI